MESVLSVLYKLILYFSGIVSKQFLPSPWKFFTAQMSTYLHRQTNQLCKKAAAECSWKQVLQNSGVLADPASVSGPGRGGVFFSGFDWSRKEFIHSVKPVLIPKLESWAAKYSNLTSMCKTPRKQKVKEEWEHHRGSLEIFLKKNKSWLLKKNKWGLGDTVH